MKNIGNFRWNLSATQGKEKYEKPVRKNKKILFQQVTLSAVHFLAFLHSHYSKISPYSQEEGTMSRTNSSLPGANLRKCLMSDRGEAKYKSNPPFGIRAKGRTVI